ncbi:MAG: DMT family transporter [Candidatus Kariarchaeaceae archaeon]|jgi:drug/metabolite transporter (DMT)-like permease
MQETKLNSSSRNLGPLFIASAAFLWTTDVFVRSDLEGSLIANQIVLMEHVFIMLLLLFLPVTYLYLKKLKNFDRKQWGSLLFIGIGGSALATIALTIGFFMGNPYEFAALVVLLQQTQPIVAIGLAHLLLKERLPRYYYILGAIAIIGVLFIILPFPTGDPSCNEFANSIEVCNSDKPFSGLSTLKEGFNENDGVKASLFGLIAAVLWGSSTVFGRYLLEHGKEKVEYFQMTTYRFFIALIFLIFLSAFVELYSSIFDKGVTLINYDFAGFPSWSSLSADRVIPSLIYLAIIVGLLSLILYYYGLKTTHASISAIFELVFPLSFFIVIPAIKMAKPVLEIGDVLIYDISGYVVPLHTLQIIGGVLLIVSSTILSYIYAKSLDKEE